MKINEILTIERENINNCHLIKDGLFWRAYEKSAMFFSNHIKDYCLTKKRYKIVGSDVVFLGFPDSTLNEVLKIAEEKGFSVDKQEKIILIDAFEENDGFEKWKDEISIYQNIKKPQLLNEPATDYNSDLLGKIRKFPVAERTPMDCQQFIVELQNIINGTI
nr:hypothetical protein [Bacteroidota bacterium]